ncbi:MAG TPA: alpha/beta hydrolase [Acidimicrobiales bacterium]|jgi:pimeloyl-ACP methyl ester carboxylesterase|nr:alpha/beta hydrolase [Acidimicrobiales bacterium]
MPTASANGIEIWYETFGDADDVPLLLVMGLGAQAIAWDVDFCRMLVDRGFYVIRFDNRDVGLSTKIESEQIDFAAEIVKAFAGQEVHAPYLIADMAADAVALLDHLEIDAAHVVGASMGGMIVQQLALDFPARVLTVTSIMSTTGDRDVGMPHPEAAATLMRPPAEDRESYIDGSVETWRVIGSPKYFDEAAVRDRAAAAWERGYFPAGTGRQLLGIMASPSRSERLEELKLPALVIHGDVDPLVDVSGGRRTAEVVPGARYLEVEDMAHDMPPQLWPVYVEAITSLVATAGQPA